MYLGRFRWRPWLFKRLEVNFLWFVHDTSEHTQETEVKAPVMQPSTKRFRRVLSILFFDRLKNPLFLLCLLLSQFSYGQRKKTREENPEDLLAALATVLVLPYLSSQCKPCGITSICLQVAIFIPPYWITSYSFLSFSDLSKKQRVASTFTVMAPHPVPPGPHSTPLRTWCPKGRSRFAQLHSLTNRL